MHDVNSEKRDSCRRKMIEKRKRFNVGKENEILYILAIIVLKKKKIVCLF